MNLIATCARHLEPYAEEELVDILDTLGDSDAQITITKMSGILTVQTILDPLLVTRSIREMLLDAPWSVRYCLRIIPIQITVRSDIDQITKVASDIAQSIPFEKTYRISIEKRNSDLSSSQIIKNVADLIDRKVSLEHPDRTLLIEILGGDTGVCLLEQKTDVFSAEKEKRGMSLST